ncbi:hypothetical protein ACXZ66_10325 [Corynebacterium sp. S7]
MAPNPREHIQLTPSELDEFDELAGTFEVKQEHLLDPTLLLYIN